MDPKDHKRLAENAYAKAMEMYSNDENTIELLDFAHGARLHYCYSSLDKEEEEMRKNIEKAEELIRNIHKHMDVYEIIMTQK